LVNFERGLVSVIIPTHNRADLLRQTVDSVLAQSYPWVEIIVVDDQSTDDTAELVKSYGEKVHYLWQEHRDVSAARNAGLAVAHGEYINFIDDDDLMLPEKLTLQVARFNQNPKLGLVHCGGYYIDRDGQQMEKATFLPSISLKNMVMINSIWTGALLIHRRCLEDAGGFDEELSSGEDWDLWLKILLAGYCGENVQEALVAIRIYPGSKVSGVMQQDQCSFMLLDRFFARNDLPQEVQAVKKQAYANTHLWLSWRYFANEAWEEAGMHLDQALARLPDLGPEGLYHSLLGHALSVRIENPVHFVEKVLKNLPPSANFLYAYRQRLVGNIYITQSLRACAKRDWETGRRDLLQAQAVYPTLRTNPGDLAERLVEQASKLPLLSPVEYGKAVCEHIPGEIHFPPRIRRKAMAHIWMMSASEDFLAGRRKTVLPKLVQAVMCSPSWLFNRGTVSMLVQSLPAWAANR
jgi:glycosyltransferase involved in cell wall biosynthesis